MMMMMMMREFEGGDVVHIEEEEQKRECRFSWSESVGGLSAGFAIFKNGN